MKFFTCNHLWAVEERSNALQLDDMGNPLRLCICKCTRCHNTEQMWLDTTLSAHEEVKSGKSFIVKWN